MQRHYQFIIHMFVQLYIIDSYAVIFNELHIECAYKGGNQMFAINQCYQQKFAKDS